MEIKLNSLILENFKGISYFELNVDGKNASVYGTNASGKTTLADAYFWLLFGKDSNGAANFDIKTIGTTGLDYSVTGTIEVNGKMHILQRILKEKWERKNGETEKKFKGNTTTYIIDGVPVKEKEYKAFVESEIVDEKTYQILTDPDFFAGKMDWKKRRAQLLEWFVDISDNDIVSSHKELQNLPDILGDRTVENAQKAIQADRKKLNDLLRAIPERIDEQQRNIVEIQTLSNGDEQENLDRLLKEKSEIEDKIRKAETDEELSKAKSELEKVKLEMSVSKENYTSDNIGKDDDQHQQLMKLKKDKFKLQCDIAECTESIDSINKRLQKILEQGKKLNSKFIEVSAMKFSGDTICPFCGRALLEDKIQSALDEFNVSKSNQLEEITDECAKLKLERSEIKKTLIVHSNNLESAKSKLSQIIENIELLEKSLAKPKRFEDTEEYKNLYEKLVAAEKNVISEEQRFNESVAEKIMKMKSRIEEINRQSSDLIAILAKVSTIKIYEDRIEELKKQESDYGVLLAEADKDLNLIDEFIKIKCLDVEKMINSHFKVVKWKLFSLQVNGGINDCCEATVDGVDYSTNLNSAAKLNAGLDIINTISDVTGINVPIWIDNAESVVSYIPTTSQTIKLTVSKEYKKLTIKE